MAVATPPILPVEHHTEHPHIVRVAGILGGSPIIRGSRISVRHIAVLYKMGDTVEEILRAHPHLTPAGVYDAISYYHDHQKEIEVEIEANKIENVLKETGAKMDKRGFITYRRSRKKRQT